MSALVVQDLSATLGRRGVLDGVSFTAKKGELIGLVGVNGAGKSTLLRALVGLLPSHGDMESDGDDLRRMGAGDRARRIAYLPQEREIAWPIAVADLVALGRTPHRKPFASLATADLKAIDRAMAQMDVGHLRAVPATELSGGERARVLIARALAQEAPLLLVDEPTAGLDPGHQIDLMQVLTDLAAGGTTVLVCIHDLALAARWCSRILLIDAGKIKVDGLPTQVLTHETLGSVYGVTAHIAEVDGRTVIQPLGRAPSA
ncbi:ABC transporter ATP-binding protein [Rhizobium sp. EC-SD404]|uniref:ABC transporter ATP-binding protein n=1 Tax=Rhizobium sp. EC-SD404 TaxID=2038389 RepID=UPI001252F908|nr:ABC transporter ATP-binding protein [Rhizobium sp. EC-SD404]VVT05329.1 ABC transporter [Rhizobium sp. EC-SD404]